MINTSGIKRIVSSQKFRVFGMLAVLMIIVTVGIFAYDYYSSYEGYPYGSYDDYIDNYNEHDNRYAPYYYDWYNFVAIGYDMIYLGDFEVYDYDHNWMLHEENIYYVCIEDMSGNLIGPRMGISVHFSPNGGSYIPGHNDRTTLTGTPAGGTITVGNMPIEPTHQLGLRYFMGWNTEQDGRGTEFTGDTWVSAINGPFTVYAKWGVNVTFSLNGASLPIGTDQNNPNHFVVRGLVPLGWSIAETPGMVFPRDLDLPSDWPLHSFWGWFNTSAPIGGDFYYPARPINGPTWLHARWTAPNLPAVTFNPTTGSIAAGHNPVRLGRLGMSIFRVSGVPGPHDPPRLNYDRIWPRSAPLATKPNATLEGWWTQPDGWGGSGSRWASPGANHLYTQSTALVHPNMFLHTPITGDLTVYAHWVYRVWFHPNEGQLHPQPKGFPGYTGHAPADGNPGSPGYPSHPYYPSYPHAVGIGTGALILFRDIPMQHSGSNIATHGYQYNREDQDRRARRYVPPGHHALLADNCVSRPGYTFTGWWDRPLPASPYFNHPSNPLYTGRTGDAALAFAAGEFTATTTVSGTRTVYAHWVRNDRVVITFDTQGGTWPPNTSPWSPMPQIPSGTQQNHFVDLPVDGTIAATPGQTLNPARRTMPLFPVKEGYIFIGWYSHPWIGNESGREYRCNATCARATPCPVPGCRGRGEFMPTLIGQAEGHRRTWWNISRATHSRTVYAHWVPYVQVILHPNGGINHDPRGYRLIGYGYLPSGTNNTDMRVSVATMNSQTNWNQSINGAPGDLLTLPNPAFVQPYFNIAPQGSPPEYVETLRRDGYARMISQWQWRQTVGTGPRGTPQHWYNRWQISPPIARTALITTQEAGTVWNVRPDGTGHFFGNGSYVDAPRFEDYIIMRDGRRVLYLYAQWAVPVVFNPNVGGFGGTFLTPPGSRTMDIAAGHTYNNRIDHRHTPPKFDIPSSPPTVAHPGFIYTLYWPDPSTSTSNWWAGLGAVQHDGQAVGSLFVEWNTCPNGTGSTFTETDTVPFLNQETFVHYPVPLQLYAIWGGARLTFSCGTPCLGHRAGGVTSGCNFDICDELVLPQNRTLNLVSGTVLTTALLPPEPIAPAGSGLSFAGWFSQPTGGGGIGIGYPATTSHWYAQWGTTVYFCPNGGQLPNALVNNIPVRTFIMTDYLTVIGTPTRPQPPGSVWTFGRWNTQPDGRGSEVVENTSPHVDTILQNSQKGYRRYVYARWNGTIRFNLMGGNIDGNNYPTGLNSIVPEFFTINEALASTVQLIANNARLPVNPSHNDPSMVFMGWRTTSPVTLASGTTVAIGTVLTRAQVGEIELNGFLDPDDTDCILRTTPTGLITLEAVWAQRLVFTKTGENLYNTANRAREPRDGAIFRLYRNAATPPSTNWVAVTGNITSGPISGGNPSFNEVGTATGNTPFAAAIPASAQPGLVVMNVTTPANRVVLTSGGQYRLVEVQPPPGYMREGGYWRINMHPASTHPDARINTITPVNFHPNLPNPPGFPNMPMEFVDWNDHALTPRDYLLQDLHVGNRRPRLMFTKHNRYGEPLNGVQFVVERYNTLTNQWVALPDADQPLPSGSAFPNIPGQTAPGSMTGVVVIPRPFSYSSTGQYRLREVGVPAGSGYLIPVGVWNIVTNINSGVTHLNRVGAAPSFAIIDAHAQNPNAWDVQWFLSNTPTRYWPFFKTDHYLHIPGEDHEYLPGAEFRLYVYNGPGEPGANTLVTNATIGTNPGEWTLVQTRTSNGGLVTPDAMWFPMMPGRYYQLVEARPPAGFQLPFGQWRITVTGADQNNIQGTGLSTSVVGDSSGTGTPTIVPRTNHFDVGGCSPNCLSTCTNHVTNIYNAFLISNRRDIDLPMTGGTGIMVATATGSAVIGLGLALLFLKKKGLWKPKAKAAE
ncbi:MAG: InlB B-repeat-containing protein [Defluviitaleaceae bacterium]|nr:InlB B-repeat-containing protein [Defluviitaleaceae bacterium]